MSQFHRVRIEGFLSCKSPIHFGSGDERAAEIKPDKIKQASEQGAPLEQRLINTIIRDNTQKPYLPGSSLRGYLRSQVDDPVHRQSLFGLGRQRSGEKEMGNIGKLRVYDATIQNQEDSADSIDTVTRTSIDPVTRTAAEHQLATHEVLAAGASFHCTMELDRVTEDELLVLLQVLTNLSADNPSARMGKSKSIGQGRIVWSLTKVCVLTDDQLKHWLLEKDPALVQEKSNVNKTKKKKNTQESRDITISGNQAKFISRFTAKKDEINLAPITDSRWLTLALKFTPQSPILINDPNRVAACVEAAQQDQHTPDLIFTHDTGKAIIPGSTLKGWLRSHCRKILLTITQGENQVSVDQLIARLFGSTETGLGILQFNHAESEIIDAIDDRNRNTKLHQQSFIAIDRFTGGTKSGALYTVNAIWPDCFTGQISLRRDRIEDWMKILLLYALRDAMQGDLVLGWGKSKGFGQLSLVQNQIKLAHYTVTELTTWRKALDKALQAEVAA